MPWHVHYMSIDLIRSVQSSQGSESRGRAPRAATSKRARERNSGREVRPPQKVREQHFSALTASAGAPELLVREPKARLLVQGELFRSGSVSQWAFALREGIFWLLCAWFPQSMPLLLWITDSFTTLKIYKRPYLVIFVRNFFGVLLKAIIIFRI